MKPHTIQEIDAAFEALPPELIEAMNEVDIDAQKKAIAEKYALHVDKAGILDSAITDTLIGLMQPTELQKVLMDNLGLSLAQSPLLLSEVNEKIFKAIRTKMQEIEELNTPVDYPAEEEVPETQPETPVVAMAPEHQPMVTVDINHAPASQDAQTILKNSDIELEEKSELSPVSEALDLSRAQALNRDTLMQNIEHPVKSETAFAATPLAQAPEKPAVVGVENALRIPKIAFEQNIAAPASEPIPAFMGMPRGVGNSGEGIASREQRAPTPAQERIVPTPVPPAQPVTPSPKISVSAQGTPLMQQFASLHGISPSVSQVPEPSTPTVAPTNIVAAKLQTTFKLPQEESNYSVPAISGGKASVDPYREQF